MSAVALNDIVDTMHLDTKVKILPTVGKVAILNKVNLVAVVVDVAMTYSLLPINPDDLVALAIHSMKWHTSLRCWLICN